MPLKALLTVSILAIFLVGAGELTPANLECEHAFVALKECCVGIELSENLCSVNNGCDGTRPLLQEEDSVCIREMSCDHLTERGADGRSVCERVELATEAEERREFDTNFEPATGICQ